MKTILIDDELQGRNALKTKLKMHCPRVEIIGEAENGAQGIELINKLKPDLLFLDIEMPVMTGFEMLNTIQDRSFQVIFTTAYDHYAIKAIRYAAFDYLLKPIDAEELIQCTQKLEKIKYPINEDRLQLLQNKFSKIALATSEGLIFSTVEDILYLEADSNYTIFHFKDKSKQIVSKTLKDFEELLPGDTFFRSHHSFLINLQHIKKYLKNESQIELTNGSMVDLSRRKKEEFLKIFVQEETHRAQ